MVTTDLRGYDGTSMSVAEVAARVAQEVGKAVVGQNKAVEQSFIALLADGHVLLQGVPGLGKTLLVRTLAQVMQLEFKRIQFTPDLMPSDVTGTNIFDPRTAEFSLRKGPIFTSVLLADEINRTPPKTQASLLEAMEERQTTIDGVRYPLPSPFIVFATQNPIEYEGTYPLPEAQQDRFLFKVLLDYPAENQEVDVLRRFHEGFRANRLDEAQIVPVLTAELLHELRKEVAAITMEDKIFLYIQQIVGATRRSSDLLVGGSPRAGLALVATSKALAAIRGRTFVIPDDVKELAMPVLRHRVIMRPEAEIEGYSVDQVLQRLLDVQTVPR
ncbi:MAG: MoxR family ATPase [Armatimonadetes bacterium]|nr:MoxR family ATPase [Armatimonadota bacterium]